MPSKRKKQAETKATDENAEIYVSDHTTNSLTKLDSTHS